MIFSVVANGDRLDVVFDIGLWDVIYLTQSKKPIPTKKRVRVACPEEEHPPTSRLTGLQRTGSALTNADLGMRNYRGFFSNLSANLHVTSLFWRGARRPCRYFLSGHRKGKCEPVLSGSGVYRQWHW